MIDYDKIKKNERSVLETFQAEIPSVYFSDKTEEDFLAYKSNAEFTYRSLFKFPREMFYGKRLIDFGAGTGENTVSLANWGSVCTLVEMNNLAQDISKEIFEKYTDNFDKHNFILSSIFDFEQPENFEKFDIVHCRGVLSHTVDKEGAFNRIVKYLKPGGYLIFGDPNKVGGFQNMLQRFTIYSFAKTWDEMVDVSEKLFGDDIDRSQSFVNRTRRTIIFDRWVVQRQDDPSVKEVLNWFQNNQLSFYSSYPSFVIPFFSDSVHHQPKLNVNDLKDIGSLSEAIWMCYNNDDSSDVPQMLNSLTEFSSKQEGLTDYVARSDANTRIDVEAIVDKIDVYLSALESIDLTLRISSRMKGLLSEVKDLVTLIGGGDLDEVSMFIKNTMHLFRGAVGVRHVDFIGYKPR